VADVMSSAGSGGADGAGAGGGDGVPRSDAGGGGDAGADDEGDKLPPPVQKLINLRNLWVGELIVGCASV
jgi:hypothetical protein